MGRSLVGKSVCIEVSWEVIELSLVCLESNQVKDESGTGCMYETVKDQSTQKVTHYSFRRVKIPQLICDLVSGFLLRTEKQHNPMLCCQIIPLRFKNPILISLTS